MGDPDQGVDRGDSSAVSSPSSTTTPVPNVSQVSRVATVGVRRVVWGAWGFGASGPGAVVSYVSPALGGLRSPRVSAANPCCPCGGYNSTSQQAVTPAHPGVRPLP